ncbi:unnamed protein product [Miscanthus lutarioriparius]|uniref:Chalcone synthase n=1 Tax=Miscanthus lutarioriparius TaxID=422564 RepID=A0A811Q2D0_9POAL|nr:unnamed protein product [Miscanthus lutarioriparius]
MTLLMAGDQETLSMGRPHGNGRATIMGIGKALPEHVFEQKSFPDYYFDITDSKHLVDLKARFAKICEKTTTEKRHFYMSDEWLRSNPSATAYKSPSLILRQEITDEGVPRLGVAAARKAIEDWGRHASDITHLVVSTTSSGCLPGADWELVKLLGLPLSTKRLMMYQAGCHSGCSAIRVSKDLAENNPGARVLVVACEVYALSLRGPSEDHLGNLVGQALFGDAAGAVVVGCNPSPDERAMFELVSTSQEIVPGTGDAIVSKLRDEGIVFTLQPDVPLHVSGAVGRSVERALQEMIEIGGSHLPMTTTMPLPPDLNDEVFWVVHAGGRQILDRVETALGLTGEKLAASRHVMRQYGNTRSSCVILVMEEMRRRSKEQGLPTPGEGLEWGLLIGFGPGITVETILLRALAGAI